MKTQTKYIIGIALLVVIGIGTLLYYSNKAENRTFNKIELSTDNMVVNKTEISYLDTVASVGLDELGYKGILILVRPMSNNHNTEENLTLKAFIVQYPHNQYLLQIDKSSKHDIINTIAHELIHVHQYQMGYLDVTKDYVIWKGDTLRDNIPEYFDRPWEIEAVGLGRKLETKIKDKLYN